jgi:hypothetical protein
VTGGEQKHRSGARGEGVASGEQEYGERSTEGKSRGRKAKARVEVVGGVGVRNWRLDTDEVVPTIHD